MLRTLTGSYAFVPHAIRATRARRERHMYHAQTRVSLQFFVALVVAFLAFLGASLLQPKNRHSQTPAVITATNPFIYTFNSAGVLNESASSNESTSPYWWLNSGARLTLDGTVGSTIQNNLPSLDLWRLTYRLSNPVDTDNGYHPQNIFRLVTKSTTNNVRVESLFKIEKDNMSASPNRNASNGLLLMSRYQDGDNLYYAGLRVDGTAVIKKKYRGTYATLAQKEIFPGTYVRDANTNLLPHNEWIGLRVENVLNADGSISVTLFMKRASQTTWTKILTAKDASPGSLKDGGRGGIRTDFMDVRFDTFKMEAL